MTTYNTINLLRRTFFIFCIVSLTSALKLTFNDDMPVTEVSTLSDDEPVEIRLTDDEHLNNIISRSVLDKDNNCIVTLEVNFEKEGFLKLTENEGDGVTGTRYHYVANGQSLYILSKKIDLKNDEALMELCKDNETYKGEDSISYLNNLEWSIQLVDQFLNEETTPLSRFVRLESNDELTNFWVENRPKIFGNLKNMETSKVEVPVLNKKFKDKEEFVNEYLQTFKTHIDELMTKLKGKYGVNFDSHEEKITKIVDEIKETMLSAEFHYKYLEIREKIIEDFENYFAPVFKNDLVFVFGLWKKLLDTQDYNNRKNNLAKMAKFGLGTTNDKEYEKINWEKRMEILTVYITSAIFSGFNEEFKSSKCSQLVDAKYDLLKDIGKEIEKEVKAAIEKKANENTNLSVEDKKQHNKDFYDVKNDIKAVFDTYLNLHKDRDPTVHDFSEKMIEFSTKYWNNIHEDNKQSMSEVVKGVWSNPTFAYNLMAMLGAGKPLNKDDDRYNFVDYVFILNTPSENIVIDESKRVDSNEDVISESNDSKNIKLNEAVIIAETNEDVIITETNQDVLSESNKSPKKEMHESPKNDLNISDSNNKIHVD